MALIFLLNIMPSQISYFPNLNKFIVRGHPSFDPVGVDFAVGNNPVVFVQLWVDLARRSRYDPIVPLTSVYLESAKIYFSDFVTINLISSS